MSAARSGEHSVKGAALPFDVLATEPYGGKTPTSVAIVDSR